jgi:putative ABC transport system ATP-binding protein
VGGGSSPVELSLRGVSRVFRGPMAVQALRPTDLRIDPGELVGIVGRSGSGKSTLLNVLGLLDRPSTGLYRIRGLDAGRLSEPQRTALRSRHFGFVFQRFHLLADRTVQENVELALLYRGCPRALRRRRAAEALERVGLSHRLHAFPSTLSGGECQRVALARGVAQAPRVLLCDEPTGNLDRSNSDLVVSLLRELNAGGLTVVLVTHDADIAATLPRCLRIDDGTVSEDR